MHVCGHLSFMYSKTSSIQFGNSFCFQHAPALCTHGHRDLSCASQDPGPLDAAHPLGTPAAEHAWPASDPSSSASDVPQETSVGGPTDQASVRICVSANAWGKPCSSSVLTSYPLSPHHSIQVPSSAWPKFVDAVLRKDYAVGYLLLMSVGQSTLVLSSLLASLALGSRSPRGQKVRGLR